MFLKMINPFTYISLLNIIENEKPDVIHMVVDDLIIAITLIIVKQKEKIMILMTDHDPKTHSGLAFLLRLHLILTKFIMYKISLGFFVHGNEMKKILIKKGIPNSNIFVIPHGDYLYYTKWSENKIIESNKKIILYFGIISEYKGLQYLIEAEPLISKSIPNIKIIIAGSGDFKRYHALIKNPENFEIHNYFIPDMEVSHYFQSASIVVLPYIDASQSGVIPVAYAFKKPVIVTNVGSLTELVDDGKTGIIIPPKNTEKLAETIIKMLLDERNLQKMGENAYQKIVKDGSWDLIAKKTLDAYASIHKKKFYED